MAKRRKSGFVRSLGSFVQNEFEIAKRNRDTTGINDKLIRSQRQYNGIYDEDIQTSLNEMGGTRVYRRLTASKSDALVSWLNEIFINNNEQAWGIKPSPIPDLPDSIKREIIAQATTEAFVEFPNLEQDDSQFQMAQQFSFERGQELKMDMLKEAKKISMERAKGMEKEISDQLIESDWRDGFFDFITNYSIFQNAFLKGPILEIKKVLDYSGDKPVVVDKKVHTWYAPNPFDIYPSIDASDVQDGRIFELVRYSRDKLATMRNLPNYDKAAIDRVLKVEIKPIKDRDEYIRTSKEILQNKYGSENTGGETLFEGVEMWGSVPGWALKQMGLDVQDTNDGYEAHVIMVGHEVILATINENPLQKRPYYMASFKVVPGSFWGISLPESMADIQRACNGSIRAILDNLAIASGPMVAYDLQQIPPEQDITSIFPWKITCYDGQKSFNTRKAVEYFQPDSNANELLQVYNQFKLEADDVTGIPSFASGSTAVKGAGETASGLSILQSNLTKGIRDHLARISMKIIEPAMGQMFDWNMLYNPDPSIKGDAQVVIKGPLTVDTKETKAIRLNEFLNLVGQPLYANALSPDAPIELLRRAAKNLEIKTEGILPDEDEIQRERQVNQINENVQQTTTGVEELNTEALAQ